MKRLRLTDAQISALECREPAPDFEPVLAAAWQGRHLVFSLAQVDALFAELRDASNAEDAQHQQEGDVFAGRAARSLAALAGRVLRS